MCPTSLVPMQFQIGEENQTKRPQMKKNRRPKKRKNCSLFGSERMLEKLAPVKQRRAGKAITAAPENTTQFIMADKEILFPSPAGSPNSEASSAKSVRGTPLCERDLQEAEEDLVREFTGLDFDFEYFQRDFDETYSRIQKETLLSLSKPELVERYQQLESREDELHKQMRRMSGFSNSLPTPGLGSLVGRDVFDELEDLRRKNKSLQEENCRLKALKCPPTSAVRGL